MFICINPLTDKPKPNTFSFIGWDFSMGKTIKDNDREYIDSQRRAFLANKENDNA